MLAGEGATSLGQAKIGQMTALVCFQSLLVWACGANFFQLVHQCLPASIREKANRYAGKGAEVRMTKGREARLDDLVEEVKAMSRSFSLSGTLP